MVSAFHSVEPVEADEEVTCRTAETTTQSRQDEDTLAEHRKRNCRTDVTEPLVGKQ
jgi:hypothetical protein